MGYLNFSRAIENYIWIARRAIVEKKLMRRLCTMFVNVVLVVFFRREPMCAVFSCQVLSGWPHETSWGNHKVRNSILNFVPYYCKLTLQTHMKSCLCLDLVDVTAFFFSFYSCCFTGRFYFRNLAESGSNYCQVINTLVCSSWGLYFRKNTF